MNNRLKVYLQFPNSSETLIFEDIEHDQTTVGDLKNILYYKTGTPVNHQVIELDHKRLSNKYDKKKLSKLHMKDHSNLRMVYSLNGGCGCSADCCGCGGGCGCTIL